MPHRPDLPLLVSTDWLAGHMADGDVRVLDASNHLPAANRDAAAEFLERHIPQAAFFDLDAVVDKASPLPHTLPHPEDFSRAAGALGIGNADRVVVYDSAPFFSAPRVWWMFRYFGHENVAVLDGGLPRWQREGRPLASGPAHPEARIFHATPQPDMLASLQDVQAALAGGREQVVDARGRGRFEGSEPEFRPGVRSGHMPGALNLPYGGLVGADGLFLTPDDIEKRFLDAGVDLGEPIVTTCGSGVTAAVLSFGLALIETPSRLYDGSWTEWGSRPDTASATGPARKDL